MFNAKFKAAASADIKLLNQIAEDTFYALPRRSDRQNSVRQLAALRQIRKHGDLGCNHAGQDRFPVFEFSYHRCSLRNH